jgi:hypothetical protein
MNEKIQPVSRVATILLSLRHFTLLAATLIRDARMVLVRDMHRTGHENNTKIQAY